MKRIQRISWAVVAVAVMAVAPASGQQAADSRDVQELKAIKTAIGKDAAGLPKGDAVKGMELSAVAGIHERAGEAMMEVDNAIQFVGLYEKMQCEPDRAAAKAALINRIHLFRPLLEAQVAQLDEALALADLPATKEAGHKLQADFKAAVEKLTAIEKSLQ